MSKMEMDAAMTQQFWRAARGPGGVRQVFQTLFRVMPDLHGEVVRWGGTEDGVTMLSQKEDR